MAKLTLSTVLRGDLVYQRSIVKCGTSTPKAGLSARVLRNGSKRLARALTGVVSAKEGLKGSQRARGFFASVIKGSYNGNTWATLTK